MTFAPHCLSCALKWINKLYNCVGGTHQTFLPPSNQKRTDVCGVRKICLHSSGRGFVSISISIGETEKQCFERETSLFMCASLWLAWPPDMISLCSGSQPDVIDIHKCLKFASEYFLCPDQYYDRNESRGIRLRWEGIREQPDVRFV